MIFPLSADVAMLDQSMNTTKTSTEGAEFSRGHVSPLPAPDDLSTMPINAAEPARDGAVTPFGHSSPIPAPDDVSQMPIGEADPPGYTEPEPTSTTTAQCIHPGRKAEISMANCSLCEMHVDKVWQCGGCRHQWCADCYKTVCYHLPKKAYLKGRVCEDCGQKADKSLLCPACQKTFCKPCYNIATENASRNRKTRKRQRKGTMPYEHIAYNEEKKGFK